MINPINLIKVDNIKNDEGSTLHIGILPDYDTEDYDFSNPKDFGKFIKDVKSEVRGSFEYREMIKYLRNYVGMDRSGLTPKITNTDSKHIKIEIHHTPFTLEDIVKIICEKRLFYHENMSVQMVSKEIMICHYRGIVGLYPLTATEHELVHNGYLFIPPSNIFGRYDIFMEEYNQFISEEEKNTIKEIERYEHVFNFKDQSDILAQSNVYIDPDGAYELPNIEEFKKIASLRMEEIKNNMYTLPTMNTNILQSSTMKNAIYFVDKDSKGEKIND